LAALQYNLLEYDYTGIYNYDIEGNYYTGAPIVGFPNPLYAVNENLMFTDYYAYNAAQTILYVPWDTGYAYPNETLSVILEHHIDTNHSLIGEPLVNITILGLFLDSISGTLYALGSQLINPENDTYQSFLWIINPDTLAIEKQVFNLTKYGLMLGVSTFDAESRILYFLTFSYSVVGYNVVTVNLQTNQIQVAFKIQDPPYSMTFYKKNLIFTYGNSTIEVTDITGKELNIFKVAPPPPDHGYMSMGGVILYNGATEMQLLVLIDYIYSNKFISASAAYSASVNNNKVVLLGQSATTVPTVVIPWNH